MIIGLSGLKGSGKTTVAKYLSDYYGFERINFKDGLVKEMTERFPSTLIECAKWYDMDVDQLFERKPAVVRALMQEYGTEVRRVDDPDYWVTYWEQSVQDVGNVVVDDVRFQNEYEAVKMRGGTTIQIINDGLSNTDNHQSETEHLGFDFDFTITAPQGDTSVLLKQVDNIIDTIKTNND